MLTPSPSSTHVRLPWGLKFILDPCPAHAYKNGLAFERFGGPWTHGQNQRIRCLGSRFQAIIHP
jgi:hypothetical protein